MLKKEAIIYYKPGCEPTFCKKIMLPAFNKLNKLFPDKNVKNVNMVDNELGKTLCTCYQILGYPNLNSFLSIYGYNVDDSWKNEYLLDFMDNSGKVFVIKYLPGQEPKRINKRINDLLDKMSDSYPDRVVKKLQQEHKKWYESVCDLRKILGYQSVESFLKAYGFAYQINENSVYSDQQLLDVVEKLKNRYKNKDAAQTVEQVFEDNSDLSVYKTYLNNRANKLFGCSLGRYLKNIGIVENNSIDDNYLVDVVEELASRYPNGSTFVKVTSLFKENPDLIAYQDELKKRSLDLYGEKLIPYLRKRGILQQSKDELNKRIQEEYNGVYEFNKTYTQIVKYMGDSKHVTIPEFIVKIRKNAFENSCITSLKFSKNSICKKIDEYAFKNCKNLEQIDLKECNDIEIHETAFIGCDKLIIDIT